MSDPEQETKGVFAKSTGEAADRGRRLGLTGDIKVEKSEYITGNNDGEYKCFSVTGTPKVED